MLIKSFIKLLHMSMRRIPRLECLLTSVKNVCLMLVVVAVLNITNNTQVGERTEWEEVE